MIGVKALGSIASGPHGCCIDRYPKLIPHRARAFEPRQQAPDDNRILPPPDNDLAPRLARSKGLPPAAIAIGAARSRGRHDISTTTNLARARVDGRTEKNR